MDKKGKSSTITSAEIRTKLRAAVQILSKVGLSFRPMEMVSHSLRSGAATKTYLPLRIITTHNYNHQKMAKWRITPVHSKYVAQFSTKVSDKMPQNKEFFTVPDFERKIQETKN